MRSRALCCVVPVVALKGDTAAASLRGVKEQRDGRDASDVGGVAAREGAHEDTWNHAFQVSLERGGEVSINFETAL